MNDTSGDAVRIYENLRSISYAPFYYALESGGFAEQGLEVEVRLSPSPLETAEGLVAGRVDVSWGGPMRVMLLHDRDPRCPLKCFCNVVGPEPFSLVGRAPNPGFRFADLIGPRVGIVSEVPTPWLTLQEDLRRAGLSPDLVVRGPERTMAENVEALGRGELDVIQVMEPSVEHALARGFGHLWHRFADRGDVGFTSFYTTRAFLDAREADCRALSRTLAAANRALQRLDPQRIARRIGAYFPELDSDSLARCIARYQEARIWPADTSLSPAAFVRLKGALLSGGFISRDIPYDRAVDDRFAVVG